MNLRPFVLVLLVASVCLAQAPKPSQKPLSKEEILELARNYVPSGRLADLVQEHGIDFVPGDDFIKALREAGAEEVLINALRGAKQARPADLPAEAKASGDQLKQHLAHAAELKGQKRYAEAEEEYRAALQLAPERADIHFALGVVLDLQKKWDEAIAENREALRLRPELVAAHNNLGLALYNNRNLEGAISEYREALRLKPNYALAHHNLGRVLEQEGNLEAAAQEYRDAYKLDPDNPRFRVSYEKLSAQNPAPRAKATVDSVRFFESGNPLTPINEREYAVRFKKPSARFIAWELQFVHPKAESRVDFDIEAVWYGPGGNLVHRQTLHAVVPPGRTASSDAMGWGCPTHPCRYWDDGSYRVEFFVDGTKLVTGSFEIH
jgi:tetratricopeptide (TPR) repeat protein